MRFLIAGMLLLVSSAFAQTGNMNLWTQEWTHSGALVDNLDRVYYDAVCGRVGTVGGTLGSDFGVSLSEPTSSTYCTFSATTSPGVFPSTASPNDLYINHIRLETRWQSVGGTINANDHKKVTSLIPIRCDENGVCQAQAHHYMECVQEDADITVEMVATPMRQGATGNWYEAGPSITQTNKDIIPAVCPAGHEPEHEGYRIAPHVEWEWYPDDTDCSGDEFVYSTAGEFNMHHASGPISFRTENDNECREEEQMPEPTTYHGYTNMGCFGVATIYYDFGALVISTAITYKLNGTGLCKVIGMEP